MNECVLCTDPAHSDAHDDKSNDEKEEKGLLIKVTAKVRAARTEDDPPSLKAYRSFSQLLYTLPKPSNAFFPPDSVASEVN